MRGVPNLLTVLRIAAIPVIGVLIADPTPARSWAAMFVFLAASLTDALDGWIARRYGLVTTLGKLLDPLADKLLVLSTLLLLATLPREPNIPGWLLVIVVGREFAVTGLRSIAAAEGLVLGAEATGKAKMLLQVVGVHFLLVHRPVLGFSAHQIGIVLLVMGAAVGVWSAVSYHVQAFRLLRPPAAGGRAEGRGA